MYKLLNYCSEFFLVKLVISPKITKAQGQEKNLFHLVFLKNDNTCKHCANPLSFGAAGNKVIKIF